MLTKKQKIEFFERLEGPEGCDFKEKIPGKTESVTWNCGGGNDKSKARKILESMKFKKSEIEAFLEKCDEYGGHCDCEILFNAEERMLLTK